MNKNKYMIEAIKLSANSKGTGGPFGSVIVKNGKIVGKGYNKVIKNHDASAHGEIMAIRDAGKKLNTFDLSDCDLYTNCEPCPMCLMAAKWANIRNIYFAATRKNAAKIGFRDDFLYKELKPDTKTGIHLADSEQDAINVMYNWKKKNSTIKY